MPIRPMHISFPQTRSPFIQSPYPADRYGLWQLSKMVDDYTSRVADVQKQRAEDMAFARLSQAETPQEMRSQLAELQKSRQDRKRSLLEGMLNALNPKGEYPYVTDLERAMGIAITSQMLKEDELDRRLKEARIGALERSNLPREVSPYDKLPWYMAPSYRGSEEAEIAAGIKPRATVSTQRPPSVTREKWDSLTEEQKKAVVEREYIGKPKEAKAKAQSAAHVKAIEARIKRLENEIIRFIKQRDAAEKDTLNFVDLPDVQLKAAELYKRMKLRKLNARLKTKREELDKAYKDLESHYEQRADGSKKELLHEGRTATGPNGQKLILRNGRWVPIFYQMP